MHPNRPLLPLVLATGLAFTACKNETPAAAPVAAAPQAASQPAAVAPPPAPVEIDPARLAAFGALPTVMENAKDPVTDAKVNLGRILFFDTRLSKNQELSCNSCHNLETFGVDNKKTSTGHKGQLGGRNSPSCYNAAGHFVQFWDGRAPDVEAQAMGPVTNPVEMAMKDEAAVAKVLKSIPDYAPLFKAAFPGEKDPLTLAGAARAIGAFERKLVTPSKWDAYLAGDKTVLSAEEKKGFNTFVETGCTTCHNGVFVGGGMYMKAGLVKPWPNQADNGRFDVTKNEADRMMFKVPSLRNIEKTAPYFHDGATASLEEAVKMMARHQLGKELQDAETGSIVTWLKTLTGTIPAAYITKPVLPASGPKTPKPDPA